MLGWPTATSRHLALFPSFFDFLSRLSPRKRPSPAGRRRARIESKIKQNKTGRGSREISSRVPPCRFFSSRGPLGFCFLSRFLSLVCFYLMFESSLALVCNAIPATDRMIRIRLGLQDTLVRCITVHTANTDIDAYSVSEKRRKMAEGKSQGKRDQIPRKVQRRRRIRMRTQRGRNEETSCLSD